MSCYLVETQTHEHRRNKPIAAKNDALAAAAEGSKVVDSEADMVRIDMTLQRMQGRRERVG